MPVVARRVVILLVAVLAVAGIAYAATLAQTGDDGSELVTSGEQVEALIPERGTEILAQEPVGIDLAPDVTGVLILNGVEIPEDQLDRVVGLNQILYDPPEEDAVVEYQAGENCVTALIWPVEESRTESRPVSWCFNVT